MYGLKLTSTKDIWIRGEDGSSLNIVFKPSSGAEDVDVSGIDADGPLLINTAGDITISAPYGSPYGIRARQGLDYSGTGALDITVRGSYFIKSQHWWRGLRHRGGEGSYLPERQRQQDHPCAEQRHLPADQQHALRHLSQGRYRQLGYGHHFRGHGCAAH